MILELWLTVVELSLIQSLKARVFVRKNVPCCVPQHTRSPRRSRSPTRLRSPRWLQTLRRSTPQAAPPPPEELNWPSGRGPAVPVRWPTTACGPVNWPTSAGGPVNWPNAVGGDGPVNWPTPAEAMVRQKRKRENSWRGGNCCLLLRTNYWHNGKLMLFLCEPFVFRTQMPSGLN